MKEFILVFPLPTPFSDSRSWLAQNASLHCPQEKSQSAHFSGIPFEFSWGIQTAHQGIAQIFAEHQPLSAEETELLEKHQSLLFLQGEISSRQNFLFVLQAIHQLLNAGASGLYMEHCGCAHLAGNWLEGTESNETSLEGWLNFIQKDGSLYTLGMEAFQLPDLCIHLRHGSTDVLQDVLTDIADALFMENLKPDSGLRLEGSDEHNYEFRREAVPLHGKGNPYHNPRGTWRLLHN